MKKYLKKILTDNSSNLRSSNRDFEALYNIMFSQSGVFSEDTDGFRIRETSFEEMKTRIEALSSALHEKIGATHSYVALAMENSVDWVSAFWAILRSGNKPYLVNLRHPKLLSDRILKTLGITYIVSDTKGDLQGEYILTSALKNGDKDFPGEFENEIAISTSATSLKDVVCFYSGKELSCQILNAQHFIVKHPEIAEGYKGRIKILAFLPFYHVFGLIAVYFWFSFYGQTIVFLPNYSSDAILKTCRKHNVTHIFSVPLLWHTIEKEVMRKVRDKGAKKEARLQKGLRVCTALQNIFPHAGLVLSQKIMHEVTDSLFGQSVRFCINGGSYIRTEALYLFNGIGYNLHNGYGMSEIGITSVELRNRPKYKNLNSIGRPFDSVEYSINDDGILLVKGNSTCNRLVIEGEEKLMDSFFDTGDRMEIINGDYYILGRNSDIIIGENGENINPDVIEKAFTINEAENFSVLGLTENGKEVTSMVVEISPYISDKKRCDLIERVYATNESLPITARVSKFYFTTDPIAPPSAVKVGRKYLLRGIENGDITLSPFGTYSSTKKELSDEYSRELLDAVKDVVSDVLGLDKSSLDINSHIMLDLGASSMQYYSIITKLGEKFSLSGVDDSTVRYTIHELCLYLERHI